MVFVTGADAGTPASHAFITENGCDRYFRYNKDLLLDHRKAHYGRQRNAAMGNVSHGESLLFSLNNFMPLFFIMVLGCLLHRKKLLTKRLRGHGQQIRLQCRLPVQLFRDLATMDVRPAARAYVLFCAAATTASILVIWGLAKLLLKDKHIVGEFVQACYRSSAAILGAAFIQNIYGTSGMSGLMILGSVLLYNIFAVVILTLESPSLSPSAKSGMGEKIKRAQGHRHEPHPVGHRGGFCVGVCSGCPCRPW